MIRTLWPHPTLDFNPSSSFYFLCWLVFPLQIFITMEMQSFYLISCRYSSVIFIFRPFTSASVLSIDIQANFLKITHISLTYNSCCLIQFKPIPQYHQSLINKYKPGFPSPMSTDHSWMLYLLTEREIEIDREREKDWEGGEREGWEGEWV